MRRLWRDDSEREKHPLTDADAAEEYVEQTGVDALAISIGEVSGFDSGTLNFDGLKEIEAKLRDRTHLCLHGVSFIKNEDIRRCIAEGITYFGCATEFRYAFFQKLDAVRKKRRARDG